MLAGIGADEQGAAGHRQRFADAIVLAAIDLVVAEQAHAPAVEIDVERHRVEPLRVGVLHDLGAEQRRARRTRSRSEQLTERLRLGQRVVIEEPHPLGAVRQRRTHAEIGAAGEAEVDRAAHVFRRRRGGLGAGREVRAAVLDHDREPVAVRHRRQRPQAGARRVGALPVDDDDADARCAGVPVRRSSEP
jgi:hypothetical protein